MTTGDDQAETAKRPARITRRAFLGATGAAAALAASSPVSAQMIRAAVARPLRVGVISVAQGGHPGMQRGFLDGIRLRFDQATASTGHVPAVFLTSAADGGHRRAYTAASTLLGRSADVVIAEVSAPVASMLAPLFADAGVPLIVANVGGHVVHLSDRRSHVLHSSLLLANASYALGDWAAAYLGKRTYLLSSAADAGYDSLFAFRLGFESGGGSVLGSFVTHETPADSGISTGLARARAAHPDFVFGHYSGDLAAGFIKAYASSSMRSVPLAGASFLADELVLAAAGSTANGIITAASWPSAITQLGATSPAALQFTGAYKARTGHTPDAFSVLGYDAASVVVTGVERAGLHGVAAGKFIGSLAGGAIQSSRGALHLDTATNTIVGDFVVRRVQVTAGRAVNVIVDSVAGLDAVPHALANMAHAPSSGYLNEYLCA